MGAIYLKCFFESTFKDDEKKTQQLGETKLKTEQNFLTLFLKRKKFNFYHEP